MYGIGYHEAYLKHDSLLPRHGDWQLLGYGHLPSKARAREQYAKGRFQTTFEDWWAALHQETDSERMSDMLTRVGFVWA